VARRAAPRAPTVAPRADGRHAGTNPWQRGRRRAARASTAARQVDGRPPRAPARHARRERHDRSAPASTLNVQGTGVSQGQFNGQPYWFSRDKKHGSGKLVLSRRPSAAGLASGGLDTFTKKYGVHIFMPKTNRASTGAAVQIR